MLGSLTFAIAAALLHDTIEDTAATRDEIDQMFGKDIGALVEGLTKLKRLDLVTKEAKQAENLRKLLLAIADDVRVLLIKLADRLHNMRTLGYMPSEARRRAAEETLEIYAFMEAADESKRQGGKPVTLESVLAKARTEAARKIAK